MFAVASIPASLASVRAAQAMSSRRQYQEIPGRRFEACFSPAVSVLPSTLLGRLLLTSHRKQVVLLADLVRHSLYRHFVASFLADPVRSLSISFSLSWPNHTDDDACSKPSRGIGNQTYISLRLCATMRPGTAQFTNFPSNSNAESCR
jgi:hypothetical protein